MITRLICSLVVTTVVTVTPAWAQDQTALRNLSAVEIHQQVRSGTLRSADLVKALLAAAEESKSLNAFITLHQEAVSRATALDMRVQGGDFAGRLHGVPIVVKENIASAALRSAPWSSVELVETDTASSSNATPHRAIHQRMTCTILQVFGSTRTGIPLTTVRRDFLTPWCAGA